MAENEAIEYGNESPTSEVGSYSQPISADEQFRALLEQQNRNFLELAKSLRATTKESQQNGVTKLPKFNADVAGADATQWCATVDIVFSEKPLHGSALVLALSESLEGSASLWLSQICFPGITWEQFKQLFVQRFESTETSAATMLNLINSRPKDGECFAVYASRKVTSLMTKWRGMDLEEIVVSVVLGHMANFDRRLQRVAYTTNVQNRRDLQSELQVFMLEKRRQEFPDEGPGPKRTKSSTIKCHNCGKMGHKKFECRATMQGGGSMRDGERKVTQALQQRTKTNIQCYRCQEMGHIATHCPKGVSGDGKRFEKRVELCVVEDPKSQMMQRGEKFQITFDSGAEVNG